MCAAEPAVAGHLELTSSEAVSQKLPHGRLEPLCGILIRTQRDVLQGERRRLLDFHISLQGQGHMLTG